MHEGDWVNGGGGLHVGYCGNVVLMVFGKFWGEGGGINLFCFLYNRTAYVVAVLAVGVDGGPWEGSPVQVVRRPVGDGGHFQVDGDKLMFSGSHIPLSKGGGLCLPHCSWLAGSAAVVTGCTMIHNESPSV